MGASATQPRKRLGAWLVRVNNTVYQAITDGFICAFTNIENNVVGLTDGATPPTTERTAGYTPSAGAGFHDGLCMPAKKHDYWKVTGATTVWWIPEEP